MAKRFSRAAALRTLRLVAPEAKHQKGLIGAGTVALLLEVIFRVMEPWPLKIVIDGIAVSRGSENAGGQATVTSLVICGLLLIAIVTLRAATNYLATTSFALAGSRTAISLRARVFHHVQGLSQQYHAHNRSADTVQRIVSDVARLQEVAITAGLPLLANMTTLAVMLVIMFVLDPLLALAVVAAIALFIPVSSGSSKKITSAARRTRKGEGQLANTAQEALSAIRIVQAYGLEAEVEGHFGGANQRALSEGVKSLRLAARLERGTDVIVGLATAVVMVGGGIRVIQGAMTPGELVLFTTYLRTTMKPLRDMAKYTGRIARASASGERVADLMDAKSEVVSPERPLWPGRITGQVAFENVVTEYDGHEVLHGLDLKISPGEHVAIIGPSGAGKSTLVSLLVRAIDPVIGRVTLDGYSLRDLDLAKLRSSVSLLHQDAVLFTGSIKHNIRLGRQDASDAEVEAAARAAHAHDFIMELPDGYETIVGERGDTLSGGQRQRIAIARALLRDTPVVILDEATTGLDPESAELVLNAIDSLSRGRTTLTVTHDAEVALRATRVVWIEGGYVLLDGKPNDLLANNRVFRDWINASGRQADQIHIGG
ncbi:ABC transporter ATP-binding protein [Actinobaculum sp. 352]|uniref:ABC transporter ATP-binding protein n=1 Tax=Actinobaculum sp. 352 TaxID=2490946 RepID=UPI000F7EAE80|nr:ABC transporter ATP-binding protein [Actinobaculum sp. 352]RTE48285.1 ABC transporter ATP-binding protein [Actinobaculum sp. 352]